MLRLPDLQKIDRLFEVMKAGKSKGARTRAKREISSILNQMARAANYRLRSLESAGLSESSPAYRGALAYTERYGRKRFSTKIISSRTEILALRNFLGQETSTRRGARIMRNKTIDRLRANHEELRGWSDREIEQLQEFLGQEGVDEYLALYADSDQPLEQIITIFEANKQGKAKILFKEYAKYLKWQEDGQTVERAGLTSVQIREEFLALYESIDRRKR